MKRLSENRVINKILRLLKYKRVRIPLVLLALLFGALFFWVAFVAGATYTWDGEGTTNDWSECANWSSNTCPGGADIAQFNNTSDKDATVDAGFAGSVAGVNVASGYDGTITQSRSLTVGSSNFVQASGVWDGTDQNLDINDGSFTVSGGSHTATTGTWTLERSLTYSGGTLDMTGATVTLDDSDQFDDSTVTCSSIGGTINVSKDASADFTLAAGCSATFSTFSVIRNANTSAGNVTINGSATGVDITIYNNLTVGAAGSISLSGSISAIDSGSVLHDTTISCTGTLGPTVDVNKNEGSDFTLGSGCTATFGTFENTRSANAPAGDMTINGTANGTGLTIHGDLTIGASGDLNISGDVTVLDNNSTIQHTTISCTGTIDQTINVTKDEGSDFNVGSGCTVNVGTFSVIWNANGTSGDVTVNGTINGTDLTLYGNLTVGASGNLNLSGTISILDGGSTLHHTTISCTGSISATINITKDDSGDFTLGSGCSITTGTFTVIRNAIVAGGDVTINGSVTGTNLTTYNHLTIGASGSMNMSGTITLSGNQSAHDSTLTCNGSITGGNMTINKTTLGAETTLATNCTIPGNFTRTDGVVTNPGVARTLTVQGNFSMSTTDTFGGANLTLNMGGSAAQTVTLNAGTMSGNFSVNKSGGSAALTTSFAPAGTCNIIEGVFDISGQTFTCTGGFTVEDGGILELYGSETPTAPTLATGSTVRYTGDSGADVDNYTIKDYSYYHLSIASVDAGDTFATPNATEDVLGGFSLSGGTFTAPSSTLTVGGNFARSGGTFTHNNGTVTFSDAAQNTTISGSTTFYNLSSTTANKDLIFTAGTTQTVNNTLTFTGAASQLITLTSSSSPTQWNIVSNGTENVSYVSVRDSNACGGNNITATDSDDVDNNDCWNITGGGGGGTGNRMQGNIRIQGDTRLR